MHKLEEEILRREAEILSGAKTNPVGDPELPNPQDDGKDGPHPRVEMTSTLTQEQPTAVGEEQLWWTEHRKCLSFQQIG